MSPRSDMNIRSGDVFRVTRAASVQFTQPIMFRVIRVHDWTTYEGWTWLDGYQLNKDGDAVERRTIFVQPARLFKIPVRLPGQQRPVRPVGVGNTQHAVRPHAQRTPLCAAPPADRTR